jgi:16S rRNA (cytosine967-C5)-methyltransferase
VTAATRSAKSRRREAPGDHAHPRSQSIRKGPSMRLVDHLVRLISQLSPLDGPADKCASQYFREHPALGVKDRRWLAEGAFAWLRYKPRITYLAESGEGDMQLRWAQLAFVLSGAPAKVWTVGDPAQNAWLGRVLSIDAALLPLEQQTCLPAWLWQRLCETVGQPDAESFAAAVNVAAPLDIRINRQKASPEQVLQALQAEQIEAQPIAGLPDGLRLPSKPVVAKLDIFRQGLFEVQDAGSQWIAALTAPRRGDLLIDFCAGAGGKTFALGAAMRNSGRIVSLDVSDVRLTRLKPRLVRSGLSNVYPMLIASETDARLDRYVGKADRVLVDAPCSGMGTLRRNPDLKWRQQPLDVAELAVKQLAILSAAARLVKPDGRLVYATCSVLPEENEDIIAQFLDAHPAFRARHWTEILPPEARPPHVDAKPDQPFLRLWPQRDGCDGFFAIALQKNKA